MPELGTKLKWLVDMDLNRSSHKQICHSEIGGKIKVFSVLKKIRNLNSRSGAREEPLTFIFQCGMVGLWPYAIISCV